MDSSLSQVQIGLLVMEGYWWEYTDLEILPRVWLFIELYYSLQVRDNKKQLKNTYRGSPQMAFGRRF